MEAENMKSSMRVIIYAISLLGWVPLGFADCVHNSGLTKGNSLSYSITLGIMVALMAITFGLKLLYANKLKVLHAKLQGHVPADSAVC